MIVGLFTPSWPGDAVANGITTSVAFMAEGLEAIGVKVLIFSADHYEGHDPRVFNLPERPLTLREKVGYRLSRDQAIAHVILRPACQKPADWHGFGMALTFWSWRRRRDGEHRSKSSSAFQ